MNAEFNWWLLIVGLVVGAGLVWLVLADSSRRESEITDVELPAEATWIAATLQDAGDDVSPETAERVLRLHRAYLGSPPPDEIEPLADPDEPVAESGADPGWIDAPAGLDDEPAATPAAAPAARSEPRRTD